MAAGSSDPRRVYEAMCYQSAKVRRWECGTNITTAGDLGELLWVQHRGNCEDSTQPEPKGFKLRENTKAHLLEAIEAGGHIEFDINRIHHRNEVIHDAFPEGANDRQLYNDMSEDEWQTIREKKGVVDLEELLESVIAQVKGKQDHLGCHTFIELKPVKFITKIKSSKTSHEMLNSVLGRSVKVLLNLKKAALDKARVFPTIISFDEKILEHFKDSHVPCMLLADAKEVQFDDREQMAALIQKAKEAGCFALGIENCNAITERTVKWCREEGIELGVWPRRGNGCDGHEKHPEIQRLVELGIRKITSDKQRSAQASSVHSSASANA